MEVKKKNIAIFISGSGTNARNLVQHFKKHPNIEVALIVSSNAHSVYYKQALAAGMPVHLLSGIKELSTETFVNTLQRMHIDLIVLAGFMWKIPVILVRTFDRKIVNIHPSLLPKFGGKGMYGRHVHRAVIENKELESGITIHYVNEAFDEGEIIFQMGVGVESYDTPVSLETKIHQLEYTHYPVQIEKLLTKV